MGCCLLKPKFSLSHLGYIYAVAGVPRLLFTDCCLLENHTTRWRLSAVQSEPNYLLRELLVKIAADVQVRFKVVDLVISLYFESIDQHKLLEGILN